jgi:hypothetical protein
MVKKYKILCFFHVGWLSDSDSNQFQCSVTVCSIFALLTVHLDILCNENQPDALFILNLFDNHLYMVRACLFPIIRMYSIYMYSMCCICSVLTWSAASQLKRITLANFCTYTANTSWWWAISMPETCRGEWRNKLNTTSASGWISLQRVCSIIIITSGFYSVKEHFLESF